MTQQVLSFHTHAEALAQATEIAGEFKRRRLARNLKQQEVAERIGVSDSAVASMENRKKLAGIVRGFPTIELTRRMCAFYGMPEAHMIERMRALRKLAGVPGEMRMNMGIGKEHHPRPVFAPRVNSSGPRMEWEPVIFVDRFPELVRPGMSPSALLAVVVAGFSVVCLLAALFQLVRVWRHL